MSLKSGAAAMARLSALLVFAAVARDALAADSQRPRAVATFESLGLYWSPGTDPGAAGCEAKYRKAGAAAWKDGLPLWYDARNGECRGSLVQLSPGTAYEVRLKTRDGKQGADSPRRRPVESVTGRAWDVGHPR